MRYLFLGLALFFVVVWAIAFLAFHVTLFLIHILLVLAVISFIVHLAWPRSA